MNNLLKRIESLEAKHEGGKLVIYLQDLDNPDIFREGMKNDGPTLTEAQIDAANAGTGNHIILVTYLRDNSDPAGKC